MHGTGPDGPASSCPSGRFAGATSQGLGEGHDRRPLGLSAASGAAQPGAGQPAGEGRGDLHVPGASTGPEAAEPRGLEEEPESRPDRRPRKRRKKRQREGSGQRQGQGEGERGDRVSAPGDPMSLWMARWRRCRSHEQSPSEVLAELWRHLRSLPGKLGHFSLASAGDGVPPGAESSIRVRSDDLLPIDLREVATYLLDEGSTVANSVACVLNTLNYLALCSGHAPVPTVMPERPLTNPQKQVIDHVRQALSHLENSGEQVAPFARMADELREARFDYAGEPILMMEDLDAEQVIAAWPAVGQAAVQEATAFLPEHIRDKLNDPRSCLLPLHEWPSRTPVSKVRASDEEWHKVVAAAHERGLMVPLDPEDVFKDASGVPVLNGAGAVPKFKTIGGQKRKCQRFISNLIPSNAFQVRIDGDDKYLPYLGQLTLLEQESDQVWLTDSEDFTSSFNLFKIPAAWHKMMGFGKLVDASAFGGPAGRKVYPAMAVVPMGWLSSVAVVQAIVRSLVFDHASVPRLTEVTKMRALPDSGDLTVIYLDSFDELRRLEKGCKEALDESMSDRHARFLQVCREKGLPLNESKRLVASTRGTLQGGLLDGELGRYGLSPDKMANLMGLASSLVGHEQWSEFMLRHLVGRQGDLWDVLQATDFLGSSRGLQRDSVPGRFQRHGRPCSDGGGRGLDGPEPGADDVHQPEGCPGR